MKFLILVALFAIALADQTADSPAKTSVAALPLVDLIPAAHRYGGYYGGYRPWRGYHGRRWRRDVDSVAVDDSSELELAEHHRRRWGGYGGYHGGYGYRGFGYGGWGYGRRHYG